MCSSVKKKLCNSASGASYCTVWQFELHINQFCNLAFPHAPEASEAPMKHPRSFYEGKFSFCRYSAYVLVTLDMCCKESCIFLHTTIIYMISSTHIPLTLRPGHSCLATISPIYASTSATVSPMGALMLWTFVYLNPGKSYVSGVRRAIMNKTSLCTHTLFESNIVTRTHNFHLLCIAHQSLE